MTMLTPPPSDEAPFTSHCNVLPTLRELGTRYWPDGVPVTPETEAAIDRIITTVHRVQAKNRQRVS